MARIFGEVRVSYSMAPIDHRNHYDHDGTYDPKVVYYTKWSERFITPEVEAIEGRGCYKLLAPPPQPSSKKQYLAPLEPEPVPGGSPRIIKEPPVVSMQEHKVGSSANDEPNFEFMCGAIPMSLTASSSFERIANFEGTSAILKFALAIDKTIATTPAPILVVWHKLAISQAWLEAAQCQKEELELKLAVLVKEWVVRAAELETNEEVGNC
ncbi:uncharacterized protein A4U43_C07F29090 [Asparagus officinalis]|uniref:Uncharacterized protein n=1 Tax=Asparagus officinalis TaxID=4686 RepID=A0A5P1EFT2_ASPOF|nr:uncharacterized protein A4U43_C07F29090 [Asparagus officinalis]